MSSHQKYLIVLEIQEYYCSQTKHKREETNEKFSLHVVKGTNGNKAFVGTTAHIAKSFPLACVFPDLSTSQL